MDKLGLKVMGNTDKRSIVQFGASLHFIVIVVGLVILTSSNLTNASTTYKNCRNETKQVLVKETKQVYCAGVFINCYLTGTCYCNVTEEVPKKHVTIICEDDDDKKKALASGIGSGRKLTDPEVAAVAVIASLVFSIIISLTVFLIQRRERFCRRSRKNSPALVEEVRPELDSFLPEDDGSNTRYISAIPANQVHQVDEHIDSADNGGSKLLPSSQQKHLDASSELPSPVNSAKVSGESPPQSCIDLKKSSSTQPSPPPDGEDFKNTDSSSLTAGNGTESSHAEESV